ncbi:MAG: outer membrane beta-barrel domain-containing protein [Deltaproteobacteria bacterium]|nr:outer membrane beta-barrel domain-containing protein [Deltaproteobacteria bacterium]
MKIAHLLLVVGILLAAGTAHAQEEDADSYAIQNRQFKLKHEINVVGGVLPLNAFVKGITVGGGYTIHFTDMWAWEIGQFYYAFGVETDLRRELLDNFQVQPTQIESINYFFSSNIIFKPFYGKFAALNRSVIHAELFFVLGPAVARFLNPGAFRVGFDAGIGLRLHLVEHLSMRLDARYMLFVRPPSVVSELHVTLGLAVSFGGGE